MPKYYSKLLSVISIALTFALPALAAEFAVGENVICKPTGSESDWREGVVTENNPNLDYIRIKCGPAKNGNPGNIFLVSRQDVRKATDEQAKQNVASGGTHSSHGGLSVGQTVTCRATGSEWDVRQGKILENNPLYDFVRVECPPAADGRPGGIFLVSRKDILDGNNTPAQTPSPKTQAALPVANTTQPVHQAATPPATQVAQTATKPDANAKCACPAQTQATSNSIEDTIKRVIIARYVKDGHALDATHTPSTVHFDSFHIVKKRAYAMPVPGAYHTGSPDGPGGRMGTEVYEVVCKYTVCVDYPGSTYTGYKGRVEMVDHDAGYTCFIDTANNWRCNQSKDSMNTRSMDK